MSEGMGGMVDNIFGFCAESREAGAGDTLEIIEPEIKEGRRRWGSKLICPFAVVGCNGSINGVNFKQVCSGEDYEACSNYNSFLDSNVMPMPMGGCMIR